MLQRDASIVRLIHDERAADELYGHGPERRRWQAGGRGPSRLRRSLGHAIVRLGAWLAAESPGSAGARPRVPSSA